MATIFSRIVKGEIPCYKIAEDENYLAFLDISPIKKGHTLVIPKTEVDYIFQLEEQAFAGLFAFAHKVGLAVEKAIPCKRIGIAVLGMEVPHAHIHLIPLDSEKDLNFANPRWNLASEEMETIAQNIRNNI